MTEPRFPGFPARMAFVPVPAPLFGSLLQQIDSLAELKLTLCLWRKLHESRRQPKYVLASELRADRGLLLAIQGEESAAADEVLDDALQRAVSRGSFLSIPVEQGGRSDACLALNTPVNQRLRERIESGEMQIEGLAVRQTPAAAAQTRPSIYELYEDNIGLLTPLLAPELQQAELTYPAEWIEEAFREAVAYNKRNWRYVRRILENWATHGRGGEPRGEVGRRSEPPEDPREYLSGRYGRFIKH